PSPVCIDCHPADRQAQSASGSIPATRVGGELFKNRFCLFARNAAAGVAYVDPIGVSHQSAVAGSLRSPNGSMGQSVPIRRICRKMDRTLSRRKLAGILQKVDENPFYLASVERQRLARPFHRRLDSYLFFLRMQRNFVDRLGDGTLYIRLLDC